MKRFAALDADGNFELQGLPPGEYTVEFEKALSPNLSLGQFLKGFASMRFGFRSTERDVLIRSGECTEVRFDVDPKRLPPGSVGGTIRGEVRIDGKASGGLEGRGLLRSDRQGPR